MSLGLQAVTFIRSRMIESSIDVALASESYRQQEQQQVALTMVATRRSAGAKHQHLCQPFKAQKCQRFLAEQASGLAQISKNTAACFRLLEPFLAQKKHGWSRILKLDDHDTNDIFRIVVEWCYTNSNNTSTTKHNNQPKQGQEEEEEEEEEEEAWHDLRMPTTNDNGSSPCHTRQRHRRKRYFSDCCRMVLAVAFVVATTLPQSHGCHQ
jgi:hypothetical protein